VLLGRLGQQRAQLFEGRAAPGAGVGVDGEVEPCGRDPGIDDPVGDGRLHRDVLEVGRTGVEGHRQLAVVDRDFGERGGQGAVPEAESGAVVRQPARSVVPDMGGGRPAQMAPAETPGDVGHGYPLAAGRSRRPL
jgi:hypothetical protein